MSPKKKKATKRLQASNKADHVRVRMYDVGFGDGFVVFFPDGDRFRTLLLDCGSIRSGARGAIDTVAKRIIADIETETGARRIDVVVATHRHRDHVAGFATDVWAGVDVGEVWLPWTEDPKDPEATRIREKQASLAAALYAGRPGRPMSPTVAALAANALSNARAMDTLHGGFRSRDIDEPRYLPKSKRSQATFKTDRLPGVLVRVLGPSRLESIIKDMDPPSGESYFAALAASSHDPGRDDTPFESTFVLNRKQYGAMRGIPLDTALEARLRTAGEMDDTELAATLESAVNGTSLMLMLDMGRVRLLLPGDAQWGTWQAALADPEWGPLFSGATFYKVGHHGSHNATPKRFVEGPMRNGIPSMASVTPVKQWTRIPLPALLEAMHDKKGAVVARSDQPAKAAPSTFKRADDDAWIETWLQI